MSYGTMEIKPKDDTKQEIVVEEEKSCATS